MASSPRDSPTMNPSAGMIPPSSTENVGIAIRTIKEFYRQRSKIKDHMKKQFSFYVSFFQIYNERVYDLLNFGLDGTTTEGGTNSPGIKGSRKKLQYQNDLKVRWNSKD